MKKILIEFYEYGQVDYAIVGPSIDLILETIDNNIVKIQDDSVLTHQYSSLSQKLKSTNASLDDVVLGLRALYFGDIMGDVSYKFKVIEVPDAEQSTDKVVLSRTDRPSTYEYIVAPSTDFIKGVLDEICSTHPNIDPDVISEVNKAIKQNQFTNSDGFDLMYACYDHMGEPVYPYILANNIR